MKGIMTTIDMATRLMKYTNTLWTISHWLNNSKAKQSKLIMIYSSISEVPCLANKIMIMMMMNV